MEFLKQPRSLFDSLDDFKQAGLAEVNAHRDENEIAEDKRIIKHPSGLWNLDRYHYTFQEGQQVTSRLGTKETMSRT
eukprot:8069672-Alexandrium_andersonii.AAC.1